MKKWAFIIGFTVLGLFFGAFSADAATYTRDELTSKPHVFVVGSDVNSPNLYLIAVSHSSDTKFFVDSRGTISGSGFDLYANSTSPDGNFTMYGHYPLSSVSITLGLYTKLISASVDIYSDDTFTEKVFLAPPPPYVITTTTTVEGLPKAMTKTMVDGGIISTGLMVLAILLGVSLVPRLIYSFLR